MMKIKKELKRIKKSLLEYRQEIKYRKSNSIKVKH